MAMGALTRKSSSAFAWDERRVLRGQRFWNIGYWETAKEQEHWRCMEVLVVFAMFISAEAACVRHSWHTRESKRRTLVFDCDDVPRHIQPIDATVYNILPLIPFRHLDVDSCSNAETIESLSFLPDRAAPFDNRYNLIGDSLGEMTNRTLALSRRLQYPRNSLPPSRSEW